MSNAARRAPERAHEVAPDRELSARRPFRAELQAAVVRYLCHYARGEQKTAAARKELDFIDSDPQWISASQADVDAAIDCATSTINAVAHDVAVSAARVLFDELRTAAAAFIAAERDAPAELRAAIEMIADSTYTPAAGYFGEGTDVDSMVPWVPLRKDPVTRRLQAEARAKWGAGAKLEPVPPPGPGTPRLPRTLAQHPRRPAAKLTEDQRRRIETAAVALARLRRGERMEVAAGALGIDGETVKKRKRRARARGGTR